MVFPLRAAFALFVVLAAFGHFSAFAAALTPITSCNTALSVPGETYSLSNDLTNVFGDCLDFVANGVTLECFGHSISGVGSFSVYALDLNAVDGATVRNCDVKGSFVAGLHLQSAANSRFYNGSLNSTGIADLFATNATNNSFTNTTANGSRMAFGDPFSYVDSYWYVDSRVQNLNAQPIQGASVTINALDGSPVYSGGPTDASGAIPRQVIREVRHASTPIYDTPHLFAASKSGHAKASNETINKSRQVVLVMDESPKYFDASSVPSVSSPGAPIIVSVRWSDAGLEGYIFSSNFSGIWANQTFVPMTGTENWSNVTVNAPTASGVYNWRIYAVNTVGNWNYTADAPANTIVVVAGPVAFIRLYNTTKTTLPSTYNFTFTARAFDSYGNENTSGAFNFWSGNESSAAYESGNGTTGSAFKAVKAGNAIVSAVSTLNPSAFDSMQVTVVPGPLHSLEVQPAAQTSQAGLQFPFDAAGYDVNGNLIGPIPVDWASENASVALYFSGNSSSSSIFDAVSPGTTLITASSMIGNSSIYATSTATTTPGNAAFFVIDSPSPQTAGVPFIARVVVYDSLGNVKTNYLGTVHFGSSDASALLPLDYSFTSSDAGNASFNFTFFTSGNQTYNVSDTANPGLNKTSANITVEPGNATSLQLSPSTEAPQTGTDFSVGIVIFDAYGNRVAAPVDVALSSDASAPALFFFNGVPAGTAITITGGTGAFTARYLYAATVTITATSASATGKAAVSFQTASGGGSGGSFGGSGGGSGAGSFSTSGGLGFGSFTRATPTPAPLHGGSVASASTAATPKAVNLKAQEATAPAPTSSTAAKPTASAGSATGLFAAASIARGVCPIIPGELLGICLIYWVLLTIGVISAYAYKREERKRRQRADYVRKLNSPHLEP